MKITCQPQRQIMEDKSEMHFLNVRNTIELYIHKKSKHTYLKEEEKMQFMSHILYVGLFSTLHISPFEGVLGIEYSQYWLPLVYPSFYRLGLV